ncbi:hypothetical protein GLW08_19660 [Pontibacillus yanchengensis]|uniref:Uncharacterized protein n=1 Tax=Pontibacillus yanchengensis TaxID=462910 RepID=A0ACC7VMG7_9BACI|nr:hypothetical protein [Pontibacillus yanchengensis]
MKTASVNMAVFRLCSHGWLKQILTVAAVAVMMLCLSLAGKSKHYRSIDQTFDQFFLQ